MIKRKFSWNNWFMFCDARENLSHEETIQLLKKNGVSDDEIKAITEEYYGEYTNYYLYSHTW